MLPILSHTTSWETGVIESTGARKKKRWLAIVGEHCTGCAGTPVCIAVCPIEGAIVRDPDEDAYPFSRVRVVPELCIGCQICGTRRYDEALDDQGPLPLRLVIPNTQSPQQEGCPWDAIVLVPVEYADEAEGMLFDR